MKPYFLISIITLLMTSCAFHNGMMTGNASITDNNFRMIKIIEGQASTVHLFGIGGLNTSALALEAKKNMFKSYPLKKGQALANVTVDIKRTLVFVYMTTQITVSADVIDFNPIDSKVEFSDIMSQYLMNEKIDHQNWNMSIGDSVYFVLDGYIKKGKVKDMGLDLIEIDYALNNGKIWVHKSHYDKVLKNQKSENHLKYLGLEIDQQVEFMAENGDIKKGVIFGLNTKFAGVKYDFDSEGKFKWDLIPLGRIRVL